ncbi:unnamed protein product [Durusdinium trenchii]|uniref:Uncharacterized protein n=1 Tax=Durusdinium trenchii TaxID=1381693 RepID=A0ABP0I6V0_9DINO
MYYPESMPKMGVTKILAILAGCRTLQAAISESLISSDECEDEQCTLNALQVRGRKVSEELVREADTEAFKVPDVLSSSFLETDHLANASEEVAIPRFYPLNHGWHKVAVDGGDTVGFMRASLKACEYFCASTKGCHSIVSCPKTRACQLKSAVLDGTEKWKHDPYCQTWYVNMASATVGKWGGRPVEYKQCDKGTVPKGAECVKADGPASMTFYQYSAQKKYDPDRVWENVDMASLGGVLFYLHNEVVDSKGEQLSKDGKRSTKFDIDRIVRFKVTVHNTEALWKQFRSQFGQFIQFDYGQATFGMPDHVKKCNDIWTKFGFEVGCQVVPTGVSGYEGGFWSSFPGRCPSMPFTDDSPQGGQKKTSTCMRDWAGGSCPEPDGTPDCTWHIEPAGYVMLSELMGEDADQILNSGGHLYDEVLDRGVGTSNNFWAKKKDKAACTARMNKLLMLFAKKFPDFDAALPEPSCDFWR